MFTMSEKSVPVGCIEVVVRRNDGNEVFVLGWFPFDKRVLEKLPRTLKYHGLTGDLDWDDNYRTQLWASDGEITFEIILGGE